MLVLDFKMEGWFLISKWKVGSCFQNDVLVVVFKTINHIEGSPDGRRQIDTCVSQRHHH
jgi:hypothetical protein